jgi:hypothetical protein
VFKEKRMKKQSRMYRLIGQYLSLNQTQKQFCEENDMKLPAFQFWLRKYCQEQTPKPTAAASKQVFIPIEFNKTSGDLSLEYPNGVRLVIHGKPDIPLIRQLIEWVI